MQATCDTNQDIYELAQSGVSPGVLLAEIVDRFGSDLKNYARYRTRNEADADDVYQDALLAALRYIKSFRGETPIKNWLLKLVTTATLQKKRGRKNNSRLHIAIDPMAHPEIDRQLVSHETAPDSAVMIDETWDHLAEAFGSITENERVMLIRHHGRNVSLNELARDFNISVPCLKTRLFRSRVALRKYVESRWSE